MAQAKEELRTYLKSLPNISAKTIDKILAIKNINAAMLKKYVKVTPSPLSSQYIDATEDEKYINDLLSTETKLEIKIGFCRKIKLLDAAKFISILPIGITPVGSFRRRRPFLGDIDLLTTVPLSLAEDAMERAIEWQTSGEKMTMIKMSGGDKKMSFAVILNGFFDKSNSNCKMIHVDLFHVSNDEWPFALLHYTGNFKFNIRLRSHAKYDLGLTLNQYGIFDKSGALVKNNKRPDGKFTSERDIFDYLGVTWLEPKDREE